MYTRFTVYYDIKISLRNACNIEVQEIHDTVSSDGLPAVGITSCATVGLTEHQKRFLPGAPLYTKRQHAYSAYRLEQRTLSSNRQILNPRRPIVCSA